MKQPTIQTIDVRRPRLSPEGGCSVYACAEPAATVVSVGGGTAGMTSTTQIRFCATHTTVLRARLSVHLKVLFR